MLCVLLLGIVLVAAGPTTAVVIGGTETEGYVSGTLIVPVDVLAAAAEAAGGGAADVVVNNGRRVLLNLGDDRTSGTC